MVSLSICSWYDGYLCRSSYSVFKLKLMYKEYVVVKRLLVVFLVMFAFEVYSEDEKEVVVGNAKELKDIKAKKITWKKDGAKMVLMIRS